MWWEYETFAPVEQLCDVCAVLPSSWGLFSNRAEKWGFSRNSNYPTDLVLNDAVEGMGWGDLDSVIMLMTIVL